MLEFSLVLLLGIIFGIMVGLLPGVPGYIGPLIMFPFVSILPVEHILTFWLSTHIGSQYFGSVAAILLKIPGEVSSLVYVRDIGKLDMRQRLDLVRQTAWGSTMGNMFALAILLVVYYFGLSTGVVQLSGNNVKLFLLITLMVVMCWFTNHRVLSFMMFIMGVIFSEKTAGTLPTWVFKMQEYTTDMTLFGLILGMLIIPEFIKEMFDEKREDPVDVNIKDIKRSKLDFRAMFRGTWIGSLMGLIPGPSHILSGIVSYNSYKKDDTQKKIISAESANNSATISAIMPFLFIGFPITLSEFLLADLLQVKMFLMPMDFKNSWSVFGGLNLIEMSFLVMATSALVYHVLAQRFLGFYEKLLHLAYGRLKLIFVALICYLVYVDLTFNPVYLIPYLLTLAVLTWIGYKMLRNDINPMPLVFGYILGDMMTWSGYHFFKLHLATI